MIVLDAPGEGDGPGDPHLVDGARAGRPWHCVNSRSGRCRTPGSSPSPAARDAQSALRLAVPETRGDQRAAIDLGVPAVTLAGRDESTLPAGRCTEPDQRARRRRRHGDAVARQPLDAMNVPTPPTLRSPTRARSCVPSVGRLALLLLALPLLVMALDAAARVRRARVRLSVGPAGGRVAFCHPARACCSSRIC